MLPPTERFSDRVTDYVRARPSYPEQVIGLLEEKCGLDSDSFVADIGCGTGIFTQQLLNIGCLVVGIEPNEAMLQAAIDNLGDHEQFLAVNGSGESTGLADHCVDLITVAQAFHWLSPSEARQEFHRILKPKGWVALVWNERKSSGSQFLEGYEKVLKDFAPEYSQVKHRNNSEGDILAWFQNPDARVHVYENNQLIDLNGLLGRAFSSSYVPAAGTMGRELIEQELTNLFTRTSQNDLVSFEYETKVFIGQLT
ncbi:MAG: class I SAM-dependent methyltransferase [Armatimonadota bacterium]